jgi:hypothetical protein
MPTGFIHHDADEFRESPWPDRNLWEAIQEVDGLGYNAIDFRLLQFRQRPMHSHLGLMYVTPCSTTSPRLTGRPSRRNAGSAEKRLPTSSRLAGMRPSFRTARSFPLQFLLRHYPIRSQEQGRRKVFEERLPRFLAAERAIGWHIQYNGTTAGMSFCTRRGYALLLRCQRSQTCSSDNSSRFRPTRKP